MTSNNEPTFARRKTHPGPYEVACRGHRPAPACPYPLLLLLLLAAMICFPWITSPKVWAEENALRAWVSGSSPWSWRETERIPGESFDVIRLELTSQEWRALPWRHHLLAVIPRPAQAGNHVFLYVTGSGDGSGELPLLTRIARQAGIPAAVITGIPNQPLFGGRKEDELLAYTLKEYEQSGDRSWPIIFPMVKSVTRAMDALEAYLGEHALQGERFIVSGASKRGWTTWLTAAVDRRVVAIAPKVFDMVNMKAQTEWAGRVYGAQSEKIRDYTELGLVDRIEAPRIRELRGWIDPWSYRHLYTMPKLILLGTNDPYWVVDAQRHYFDALPGPKAIYQAPNTGHHLRELADPATAAFVEAVVQGRGLPGVQWKLTRESGRTARMELRFDVPPRAARLWRSCAEVRDFRSAPWIAEHLQGGLERIDIPITRRTGCSFEALVAEADFTSLTGVPFSLSTEGFVIPEL